MDWYSRHQRLGRWTMQLLWKLRNMYANYRCPEFSERRDYYAQAWLPIRVCTHLLMQGHYVRTEYTIRYILYIRYGRYWASHIYYWNLINCAVFLSRWRYVRVLLLLALSGTGDGEIARRDHVVHLLLRALGAAHIASPLAQHQCKRMQPLIL